jgi:hypothetical protein
VILHDMYLRTVKVRSSSGSINEYVRVVEAYRDNGKVKQRTLADLGRKDLLVEILPKLQRFLGGDPADTAKARPDPKKSRVKPTSSGASSITSSRQHQNESGSIRPPTASENASLCLGWARSPRGRPTLGFG